MLYMYLQALYIKQTFCNENMKELEYSKQYTGHSKASEPDYDWCNHESPICVYLCSQVIAQNIYNLNFVVAVQYVFVTF